jgi:ATP-dependent RNA helicase DeaD
MFVLVESIEKDLPKSHGCDSKTSFLYIFCMLIMTTTEKSLSFSEFGLSQQMLNALEKKGFETPSPIQEQVIPLLLNGDQNIIGQAATGTGKTAAFGIPLIEKLAPTRTTQAIILTPTRELAIQVAEEINSFQSDHKDRLSIVSIYGGQSYDIQLRALKKGADIIVGTPGRVIDHLNRRTLKLREISYLILDEADEMLNMGFIDDIEEIFQQTPTEKKVLLFSATMPKPILNVAKKYMGEYQLVSVKEKQLTATNTTQIYFEVREGDKFEALCRIIDLEPEFYGIVFCKTKLDCDFVTNKLNERGYQAQGLH